MDLISHVLDGDTLAAPGEYDASIPMVAAKCINDAKVRCLKNATILHINLV